MTTPPTSLAIRLVRRGKVGYKSIGLALDKIASPSAAPVKATTHATLEHRLTTRHYSGRSEPVVKQHAQTIWLLLDNTPRCSTTLSTRSMLRANCSCDIVSLRASHHSSFVSKHLHWACDGSAHHKGVSPTWFRLGLHHVFTSRSLMARPHGWCLTDPQRKPWDASLIGFN